jgi:hypothetical protein
VGDDLGGKEPLDDLFRPGAVLDALAHGGEADGDYFLRRQRAPGVPPLRAGRHPPKPSLEGNLQRLRVDVESIVNRAKRGGRHALLKPFGLSAILTLNLQVLAC